MIDILRIRWNQFLEEARQKSLQVAFKKAVAKCLMTDRIVVPVYNNLSELKQPKAEASSSLEFLVIDQANVAAVAGMMKTKSRRLKLLHNTKAGYYAYAVVADGEIIGDIWCVTPKTAKTVPMHHDLPWLGIDCAGNEAYMFDMYVVPDSRGKVTASHLLGSALSHLKEAGFVRVYGFYEKDNLPALWTHRLFGYSELGKRRSFRLLFYKKTEPIASNA